MQLSEPGGMCQSPQALRACRQLGWGLRCPEREHPAHRCLAHDQETGGTRALLGHGCRAGGGPLGRLQLELGVQLSVFVGLLVALLQVFHKHSHHHVDQHDWATSIKVTKYRGDMAGR
ncbi:hypothetical protein MC885_020831 [Smutsia gigantea]|nr:hypothetical protein MC885_020831 [Smutsia gigantea]